MTGAWPGHCGQKSGPVWVRTLLPRQARNGEDFSGLCQEFWSRGQTKEEAIANAKEAIRVYIAALEADGLPVPPERFDTMVVAV